MKRFFRERLLRAALMLLFVVAPGVTAHANTFIKDVVLVGGNETECAFARRLYENQGYKVNWQDLNKGAGGAYIYLLYKEEETDELNNGYVTDFFIKVDSDNMSVDETIVRDGRTYYIVPYDGDWDFLNRQGDLNTGAGGKYIRLFYTKDPFPDHRTVDGIYFDDIKNGSLGECDLNAGAGGDYIYMHFTTSTAYENTRRIGTGQGNTGSGHFFFDFSRYSVTQSIFTAEEMETVGTITALSFKYAGDRALSEKVMIFMKYVEKSKFADNNDYVPVTADDKVFEGTFSVSKPGWVIIPLDKSFEYDGNSNLLICCCDPTGGAYGNAPFYIHECDSAMFYSRDDNNAINIYSRESILGGQCAVSRRRGDIQFHFVPEGVPKPANTRLSKCGLNDATLIWEAPATEETISGYAWQYRKVADEQWSDVVTTNADTKSASLSGLTANTDYQFRVRTRSGDKESVYTYFRFTTAMPLPFEWGFEDGMGFFQTQDFVWQNAGVLAEERHGGEKSFKFNAYYTTSSSRPQVLVSPRFVNNVTKKVSFYYKKCYSSQNETFQVGFGDVNGNFTWDDAIMVSVNDKWFKYEKEIDHSISSFVAIKYTSLNHGIYVDDFSIDVVSYYKAVTNLQVSELAEQSAALTWSAPASGVSYVYQYKKANSEEWSEERSVGSTSVTLYGLEVETSYDFRVKADYGEGHFSNYVSLRFMTESYSPGIPHTQGFEEGMGGWRFVNNEELAEILESESEAHTGTHCFRFKERPSSGMSNYEYLISPLLNGNKPLVFTFYLKSYSRSGAGIDGPVIEGTVFYVGYSTKTKDLADFTWFDQDFSTTYLWQRRILRLPADTRYVAIKRNSPTRLVLDDLTIEYFQDPSATKAVFRGEEKYVTTFYDVGANQLPDWAVAYTAMLDGDELVFVRIGNGKSNVIPPNTPVIIVADKTTEDGDAATKTIPFTLLLSNDVWAREGNILIGTDKEIAVTEGKIGDKTVYVLGVVDGTLGFYPFTGDAIPAGKAYILQP